jgi:hypothetical protein
MTKDISWLKNKEKWLNLSAVGMVVSERNLNGVVTIEQRFYIMSKIQNIEEFAKSVRSHWG